MIVFSSSPGSACTVTSGKLSFQVFADEPKGDEWALRSHPEEVMRKKVICWPGEYDFDGMTLRGVGQEGGRQISYVGHIDGVRCGFIDTPVLEWTDADQRQLGDIDILVIAADNPKKVAALVEIIDPRAVVLFGVKDGDLPGTAKAVGAKSLEPVGEFKVKPGTLPAEAREVVVLK